MCIYVFIYGIVKIEIYSYNKEVNTLYTVVMFTYYILPKCVKTREPEDKHCVSWCIYTSNNICDPIPLDKLKNCTALPYITLYMVWPKNEWGYVCYIDMYFYIETCAYLIS